MGITARSQVSGRIVAGVSSSILAGAAFYLFYSLPTKHVVFIDERIAPSVARKIQDLVAQKKDILQSEFSIVDGYSRDYRNPLLHIIGIRARTPHVSTNQQTVITRDGFFVPKKQYAAQAIENGSQIYIEHQVSLDAQSGLAQFVRTVSGDFFKKNKVIWRSASDILVHEYNTGYIYRVTAHNYQPAGLVYLAGYKNRQKNSFIIDTRFNDMVVIAGVGTHGNAVT